MEPECKYILLVDPKINRNVIKGLATRHLLSIMAYCRKLLICISYLRAE